MSQHSDKSSRSSYSNLDLTSFFDGSSGYDELDSESDPTNLSIMQQHQDIFSTPPPSPPAMISVTESHHSMSPSPPLVSVNHRRTSFENDVVDHHMSNHMSRRKLKWRVLTEYVHSPAVAVRKRSNSLLQMRIKRRRDKRDRSYNFDSSLESSWLNVLINAAPIHHDHPYKVTWDVLTILLSLTVGVYTTHAAIRDRCFLLNYMHFTGSNDLIDGENIHLIAERKCGNNRSEEFDFRSLKSARWIPTFEFMGQKFNVFAIFIEIWFTIDMLLNFFTQHKIIPDSNLTDDTSTIITDGKAVKLRYLKTWFAVDALSLVPWERVLLQPVIDLQNRRNWFQKTFFRSKAVIKVTPKILRNLRKTNILRFGNVAKRTGWGSVGLVKKMIRYIPKYLLFYRNMKGALLIRILRQIHWFRKIFKLCYTGSTAASSKDNELSMSKVNSEVVDFHIRESIEIILEEHSESEYMKDNSDNYRHLSASLSKDQHYNANGSIKHGSILKRSSSRIYVYGEDGQYVPLS